MTLERWQRIEELYHAAQAQAADERESFLRDACAGDPSLLGELTSLLRHAPAGGETSSAGAEHNPILKQGTLLGHYRVEAPLGAGGMGQVFRGVDTRLNRPVAIKVSRRAFSLRFRREALALSALNHPHICTLYDVGADFLVMELVDGETLEARLKRGPLPVSDVLLFGGQIASALAHAHAKGITHRDLKPGNVMVGRHGATVLDFGLAAVDGDRITQTGIVVGTPGYLAPEQMEGGSAGAHTDIYTLGMVLHEMITGRRPHLRSDRTAELADLPPPLMHVLEGCLALDPTSRWQSAGEVRALLDWSRLAPRPVPPARKWGWTAAGLIAVTGAGLAALWLTDAPRPRPAPLEVSIDAPRNTSFRVAQNFEGGFALSPDGTMIVFVGLTGGEAHLWVRRLDSRDARLLPGTERAYFPFWSPDSQSICFFTTAPSELKRINVTGGATVTISKVLPAVTGGAWTPGGTLILGDPGGRQLVTVSAGGGQTRTLRDDIVGRYPHLLPDGNRFVYLAPDRESPAMSSGTLMLHALDSAGPPRILGKGGSWPQYSNGHLMWFQDGHVVAQPFDDRTSELSGEPQQIAQIGHRPFGGSLLTNFSADRHGLLVYPSMDHVVSKLVWRTRAGDVVHESPPADDFTSPNISPDGTRLAVARRDAGNTDIWQEDLASHRGSRMTYDPTIENHPVWSPDGADILYTKEAPFRSNLFRLTNGEGRRLTTSPFHQEAVDWSPDGRYYLFTQIRQSSEIMIGDWSGGEPVSFLGHALGAAVPQFNPGKPRWIAYDYDDSGRREIYVQGFTPGHAASEARWQISNGGGRMPRWRADGRELFYLGLDGRMMAVSVDGSGPSFRSSSPAALFRTIPPPLRSPDFIYDVTPDGERFVIIEPARAPQSLSLVLLTDWLAQAGR